MRVQYVLTLEVNTDGDNQGGARLIADLLDEHRADLLRDFDTVSAYEFVSVGVVDPFSILTVEEES